MGSRACAGKGIITNSKQIALNTWIGEKQAPFVDGDRFNGTWYNCEGAG
jgi:hypothetical protein